MELFYSLTKGELSTLQNYYIYFKIYEDRKEVSVLDIIYQGRDQQKGLSEGDYEEENPETNT